MRSVLYFFLFAAVSGSVVLPESLSAQTEVYTQKVSGIVLDKQSQTPLSDVRIEIADSSLKIGALTDENGRFLLPAVPVGRRTLKISLFGYEEQFLSNLLITTGKELVLNIELSEQVTQLQTVEITGQVEKGKANNDMTTLSTRAFAAEEAGRFAGSLNDPSRMAMNFAGVASNGDSRNDIIIRGNSPVGLLWRLEGIDIPNPNHFASQGSNGGPISILNNNVLGNSDFLTGAFPAEYSNGNSGVFDLKLRNGNSGRRETMFQIGFNGLELMTEGPISKKNYSSYLASYRYSTLAVFDALGIKFGDLIGVPKFQDLSFKVNLPTTKFGTFSLWGVGGQSEIDIIESKLSDEQWTKEVLSYQDVKVKHFRGATGLTHNLVLGSKSYLRTVLAFSFENRNVLADSVTLARTTVPEYYDDTRNRKLTLNLTYGYKFNARHNLKAGLFVDHMIMSFKDSLYIFREQRFRTLREFEGSTQLVRGYVQHQFRINNRLTLNGGISTLHLVLNGQTAIEPRVGIKWQFVPKQALSLAYGLHNQMQLTALYFYTDRQGRKSNENLNFTRSQHLVLGYDYSFAPQWRVKAEGYYQHLDRIPIEGNRMNSFSMYNFGAGFDNIPSVDGLVSRGTARNVGAELTLERFLNKGLYLLTTASLFNSQYKGSDNVERSSAWSIGHVVNVLAGGEIHIDKKKKYMLFADLKVTVAGGNRTTPINLEKSIAAGETVFDQSRAFSEQLPSYFRADIKIGIRWNSKRMWQEFAFNIQNVTGHQNLFSRQFDLRTQSVITRYQLGFFPIFQYKINF